MRRVALAAVLLVTGCPKRPDAPVVADASRRGMPSERINSVGMPLVLVPSGELTMGSADGQPNEAPVHRVRLTAPFYIGKYEVTQAEFRRFIEATGYRTTAERDGGAKVWRDGQWSVDESASWKSVFVGSRRPVVAVTWHDAVAFCEWLTQHERNKGTIASTERYRLPTEAEWEWAARGGTTNTYFGTDDRARVCEFGNVPDRAADEAGLGRSFVPCNDDVGIGTAEVGRFRPNEWGIHDMMGNVWEWVRDGYGPYLREVQLDPKGRPDAEQRVVRGGSWSGKLSGLRVTHRDGYVPDLRGGAVGFRVVLETRPAI